MKKTFLTAITLGLLLSASGAVGILQAQAATEYELLAPIPIKDECRGDETGANGCKTTAGPYITGLFVLTIGIAGVLAVVQIIAGGIEYMSTDAFSGKNEAKNRIQNALWGLLLAIAAWLILNTIDDRFVNFNLSIPVQEIRTPSPPTAGQVVAGVSLTQDQARSQLEGAGITIVGPILLTGIRQATVVEIIRLKETCNCDVAVTSATGGTHASGTCSHANGYKADIRLNDRLNNYITTNYKPQPKRDDGASMYLAPGGALYAKESNHWDIVVPCQ